MYIARGEKISGFAELFCISRVVAQFRVVEAQLHIAGEWYLPLVSDFLHENRPPADVCSSQDEAESDRHIGRHRGLPRGEFHEVDPGSVIQIYVER